MSRSIFRLALCSLNAILLLSCTASKNKDAFKTVRFSIGDDVKAADPASVNDQISAEVIGHVFEGLMMFDYNDTSGNKLLPCLAAKPPTISKDGKTWTFTLNTNAKFQNDEGFQNGVGRNITAEDFIYSWKRVLDPRTLSPNTWMLEDVIEGAKEWREKLTTASDSQKDVFFAKPIRGLSAPAVNVLKITLNKPHPPFRFLVAMSPLAVVSHEVVKRYGPEIVSHPVGTGPFLLKEWIRGSRVTLAKNPSYRDPQVPKIQELHFDIIKEEQPRWLKFRKGDLDLSGIPKDNFTDVVNPSGGLNTELAAEGIQLHKTLSLTSWWIEFNLKDPLLGKNQKLRQAIASAFDRARALEILFNNRGILADAPLPPTLEGADRAPPFAHPYDLTKAKQLLSEAGFPEGKNLPELTFDLRNPSTTMRQLGELFRDNMAKAGIRVSILANSFPEALEKGKTGRFQMMLGGWAGDYPDPENFLQLWVSSNAAPGPNTANYSNPQFDRLYQEYRSELPSPQRAAKILKSIDILSKDTPAVWFYHAVDYQLSQRRLKYFHPHLYLYGIGRYLELDD
jgi:oligopeptide transport system substrate-binding protein